jgi:hypothetical protein
MRHIALALVVTATVACDGVPGPQGPAGARGAGIDRNNIYCNVSQETFTSSGTKSLTAACNAGSDVPLDGTCFEPEGLPSDAQRRIDQPYGWDIDNYVAEWRCTWAAGPTQFSGYAEICCATP